MRQTEGAGVAKFGASQAIRRVEDLRFLTGGGRYVDDIVPAGALHALFLRSTVAHAEITALDVDAARSAPGVHLVLTADDLIAAGVELGMHAFTVVNRDGTPGANPERPVLAQGRVRHVGEAIAVIIAETMAQAQDAAELITLDTEDLPVALDLSGGGAALHPEAPGNIAYDWALGEEEAVETTLAASAHRVALTVVHNRVIVNSLEPRAAYAEWSGARLHLCVNGQGVWMQKGELARMLHLPPEAVRVTTPDVGGGFGMKAMTYPEYIVISHAARVLGRAVRWASDRTEAMLSDNCRPRPDRAGRDGVRCRPPDHRLSGARVVQPGGLQLGQRAGNSVGTFSKVLTGCYDIPLAFLGAGRFHQHHARRRISRRGPPRGDLYHRADDGPRRARTGRRPLGAARGELHPPFPLHDRDRRICRRGRLPPRPDPRWRPRPTRQVLPPAAPKVRRAASCAG
jgi:aerobic carbon-monoxide dehydrogenase large subunit